MPISIPSGLWVVATPIGNLSDLSERAHYALANAQTVLCEDTRQAAKLFSALGLERPINGFERLDAHAGPAKIAKIAERLANGETMALISDAGTPGISDPGADIVAAARGRGVTITPVPGPSAVIALLSVAGYAEQNFCFRGFFPRKKGEKTAEIEQVSNTSVAQIYVWFESPNRIVESLEAIVEMLPRADVIAAKELTKLHEKFFSGTASAVAESVGAEIKNEGARGEWCFAIRFPEKMSETRQSCEESSDWVKALKCLIDAQVSAPEAARQVCQHFGAARKAAYEMALKISGKKS